MSTMSTSPRLPTATEPPPPVRWRCWPLRAHPLTGLLLVAAVPAVAMGVAGLTGRIYLAVMAGAALAISLWRFFAPVTFELNADGVCQWALGRNWQIPWRAVHRYEVFADGVLLLPLADRCAIDALRGLYVPCNGHRDEVLANLTYYLTRPSEQSASS